MKNKALKLKSLICGAFSVQMPPPLFAFLLNNLRFIKKKKIIFVQNVLNKAFINKMSLLNTPLKTQGQTWINQIFWLPVDILTEDPLFNRNEEQCVLNACSVCFTESPWIDWEWTNWCIKQILMVTIYLSAIVDCLAEDNGLRSKRQSLISLSLQLIINSCLADNVSPWPNVSFHHRDTIFKPQ